MTPFKALGGTSDILPDEVARWQKIEDRARRIFHLYGYEEIRTPLIEEAAVFTGSLGAATEIVTKQMYLFEDRGGRQVALRPEGTASVVRAFIEHGLDKTGGLMKFYYMGPMFRAERPQAGRRRQFHQIGVEVFGSASPYQDAEVIALLMQLFEQIGVKQAMLMVNNLCCPKNRPEMMKRIKADFQKELPNLCEDCKRRLEINPLRILDCKNERCRSAVEMQWEKNGWRCPECQSHFKAVKDMLGNNEDGKGLGIHFKYEPRLVRGLDYYTRTVFEVISPGLGAQNALGGGGRYDDLVESLGGQATPAIGFAVGLERILMAFESSRTSSSPAKNEVDVFVATVAAAQIAEGLALAKFLRGEGISVQTNLEERPLRRQLEQASKTAGCVLILGEDEVAKGVVTVRDMATGVQTQMERKIVAEHIRRWKNGESA